jgi:hypothetical protein
MAFSDTADFFVLARPNASGSHDALRMPMLDALLQTLADAGIITLYAGPSAPTTNQTVTAWLQTQNPSYNGEGTLWLWDSAVNSYQIARPQTFGDLIGKDMQDGDILGGTGAPAGTLGQNGDYYINISNGAIYGPKTGGNWGGAVFVPSAGGSVTSIGLSMPPEFAVGNSPITNSGTIGVTKVSQVANEVWASPDGVAGAPVFRKVVGADLPASGVTPGSYGNATNIPVVVVDSTGRITALSTVSLSAGGLPNSGVTAGTYGDSTHVGAFTVSATGIITSASAVAINFPGNSYVLPTQAAPWPVGSYLMGCTATPSMYFTANTIYAASALAANLHGYIGEGVGTAPTGSWLCLTTIQGVATATYWVGPSINFSMFVRIA